jgi:hypothetical protein
MPRGGFEIAIPVFKRSKAVRALDHGAIGTGIIIIIIIITTTTTTGKHSIDSLQKQLF